jgi:hypothetical protein
MKSLNFTPDQLDLLFAALASKSAIAAARRLHDAAHAELDLRDRLGREDGISACIVEAVLAGCDPAALEAHLEAEAEAIEARAAATRDRLADLRGQLDARGTHIRRHDAHLSALARSMSGEIALLEGEASTVQGANARELAVLVNGGFTLEQAQAAIAHAAARKTRQKLEALAAAGIAEADAPPVLTEDQVAEQQRQRAERLKTDLERVRAFLRDAVRDIAGLPGWVREAVEAGAVDLHSDAKNRCLLPA